MFQELRKSVQQHNKDEEEKEEQEQEQEEEKKGEEQKMEMEGGITIGIGSGNDDDRGEIGTSVGVGVGVGIDSRRTKAEQKRANEKKACRPKGDVYRVIEGRTVNVSEMLQHLRGLTFDNEHLHKPLTVLVPESIKEHALLMPCCSVLFPYSSVVFVKHVKTVLKYLSQVYDDNRSKEENEREINLMHKRTPFYSMLPW